MASLRNELRRGADRIFKALRPRTTMTLTRKTSNNYDVALGRVIHGEVTFIVVGVYSRFKDTEIDDHNILATDRKLFISANSEPPQIDDLVEGNGPPGRVVGLFRALASDQTDTEAGDVMRMCVVR